MRTSGDTRTHELIEENLDLCEMAARRFFIPGYDRGDTLQEAACALIEAADCYRPERGEFRPFAFGVIRRRLITAVITERREKRRGNLEALRLDQPTVADDGVTSLHESIPSPADLGHTVAVREELARLVRAFATLTPLERHWLLYAINGGEYSADVDGRRNKRAENAVDRARKKLRKAA